ncbi:MAG: tannase/feruloyl esterase family alpha/beta hydrolase [Cyanobacteria bacterium]|nr:tannase/feruloyl esterase family alpha/beta hydrolase [Cyanobacteriota bacterium]
MLLELAFAANAAACESLKSLSLPETTILSADLVPAGAFTPPITPAAQNPRPLQIPVEMCRVAGVVKPQVNFEVWLPASNWNGKFQGVGGGGFAGVISYGAMATALGRGYATASTDTGHNTPGGSWALNRPDLIVDYAWRAIHEMTIKSKLIVEKFYGNAPNRSYFVGCSTGGRQGLMEAQRFPADYDGIIAGAPANYFTHLLAGSLWPAAATLNDEATRLSLAKLAALNKGALAACDAGDGVADGLISNPLACEFDPGTLLCRRGGSLDPPSDPPETDACLTQPQIDAARKIYAYSYNPRTKEKIFPGMAPGSEITWTAMAGGPNPFQIPVEFYKYFVYSDPNWDWKTFDFDKDVDLADEKFAKLLNAVDPDLSAFKKRGGKLIMYHGWNDQLIQPYNSIDYCTSVQKKLGIRDTDDFVRLFMAPGMQHCSGGVGPNTFDAVSALEQWVEKATKPAQIVASHTSNGVVDRTRPLCPHPLVASYKGVGGSDEAGSFVCK